MVNAAKVIIKVPFLDLYHAFRDARSNLPIPEPLAVGCRFEEPHCLVPDIPIATLNSNVEEWDIPAEIDDCVGHVAALYRRRVPLYAVLNGGREVWGRF